MRIASVCLLLLLSCSLFAQSYYLFVGTYTDKGSKGIYVYRFNSATGKAEWVSNTEGTVNPSYLALAPNHKYLYAVTETARENAGSVSAFSFDRALGKLTFINKQTSGGDNPCYVAVHNSNKWIVLANYTGGSLSALRVNNDGSLQPLSQNIQHEGKGPDKARQEKAHVHSTVFSPDQQYLFSPDLGLDKVMIYSFNPSLQKPLQEAHPSFAASQPGSGPRHFTFHPNKDFAYLIEEMGGTVVAYSYKKGALKFIQRIATHREGYAGAIGSADIHISPDGKFLYASNRGDENTITTFSLNDKTGRLTYINSDSTMGKTPRNFIIDPSGNYLLVANQQTSNIVVFKRNKQTGRLQLTGEQLSVPTPVCLQMMEYSR